MPEHRYGGRKKRGLALALIVPATAVAAVFTAGLAAGNTTTPVAQPTDVPGLPSPLSPGTGNGTGQTGTGSPTATGTSTGSPTRTTRGPAVPGATTGTGTATAGATCVSPSGTASPTRTGGGVAPSPTRTSPTATRTSPTGTATSPTATGTRPGTAVVPGAAQPTGTASPTAGAQTTLMLGKAGDKSDVLVDQNGCALYLNTNDTATSTACDAACERTWIPVRAPAQIRGEGLDQSKVGTFQRPNGTSQVTYNGHQLYRFSGDNAPGEAKGQGMNDIWWLVGANGEPAR